MADVIAFPAGRRSRVLCSGITQAEADHAQIIIFQVMGGKPACRDCAGTGWKIGFRHLAVDRFDAFERSPCPCGGTDEDRVDLNDFDFGGAA